MKYTEASLGRIFILRLEHGDMLPQAIEKFAQKKRISSALAFFIGGADKDSKVVVGPEVGCAEKPIPVIKKLLDASDAMGVGTIFTNEEQKPKLHLHSSFGHKLETLTGCTRCGIKIWHIGEVVIIELTDNPALRKIEPQTGFELLEL